MVRNFMTGIVGEGISIKDLQRGLIKNPPQNKVVKALRRKLVRMTEEFNSGPKSAIDPILQLSTEAFRTAIAFQLFNKPFYGSEWVSETEQGKIEVTEDAWRVWNDARPGDRIVLSQGLDHLTIRCSILGCDVLETDFYQVGHLERGGRWRISQPYPSGESPGPLHFIAHYPCEGGYNSVTKDSSASVKELVSQKGPDIPENIGFLLPHPVERSRQ